MKEKKGKGAKPIGKPEKRGRPLPKKKEKKEIPPVVPETLAIRDETKIEKMMEESKGESSTYEEKAEVKVQVEREGMGRSLEGKFEIEGKEERGEAVGREEEIARYEEGKEELLSFFLEDEEYAIDIMIIKEIIGIINITFVPRADDYIRGIISLRGAIIPIFDLRRRLGLEEVPVSNKSRIIVISIDDEMVGLAVDGVAEVVKIRGIDIEPTPFTISGIDAEYIRGICRYKGRIIILLDVKRLLKLQEGKSLR